MTTFYAQGWVLGPTGPDVSDGVYGYDNGGFFGPVGGNLAGDFFVVTWTGTDCNCSGQPGPVSDAVLTINGMSLDLGAFNNIWFSEWSSAPSVPFLQIDTLIQREQFPPFADVFPTSQYGLATSMSGGAMQLSDSNHVFSTEAYLGVSHIGLTVVPAPVAGASLPGLLAAVVLVVAWWRRRT